jgi:hypothetical protein
MGKMDDRSFLLYVKSSGTILRESLLGGECFGAMLVVVVSRSNSSSITRHSIRLTSSNLSSSMGIKSIIRGEPVFDAMMKLV